MINVGVLEAILRLKDELSGPLATAGRNLEQTGRSVTSVGRGLLPISAGLAAAGIAALTFSTNLNTGMANVASLIPGNTARVEELKKGVQDLSIAHGKSSQDLVAGLYQTISSFGDQAGQTMEILEINSKAATGGVATTADAINLTSSITKAYGDTTAGAVQHVADLALATVRMGQTTFPELAASMGRVTPIAQSLGQSQEDLFAVFATATGVTGSAAEVATQYRGVLSALLNPTASLTELIEQQGFASGEAMLQQQGLVGTLQTIVAAAEASGEPITKYVSQIEAVPLALALAGPQADTFRAKLDELGSSAGAVETAFREQTSGINEAGFKWEQAKARLAVLAQTLGDRLAPALIATLDAAEPLINMAVSAVEWFGRLPQPVQTVAIALGAIVAAAGPVLIIIGQVISAVGTLAGAFGAGGALATGIGGFLALLTGPVGIVAGLGILAATIVSFIAKEGGMLDNWAAGTKETLAEIRGSITENDGAVNQLADTFRGQFPQMVEMISAAREENAGFEETVRRLKIAFREGTEEGDALRAALAEMEKVAQTAAPAVQSVASAADGSPTSLAPALHNAAVAADDYWARMNRFNAAIAALNITLDDNAVGVIKSNELIVDFTQVSLPAAVPEIEKTSGMLDKLTSSFSDLWQGISSGQGIGGMLSNIGAGIAEGFGQIISGGISSLINAGVNLAMKGLKALGGKIWEGLKSLFGGPSAAELAGRDAAAQFRTTVAGILDATQLAEAGNDEWKKSVIAVRDAILATGGTTEQALAKMDELWRAEKEGPEAVNAVIASIQPTLDQVQDALAATGLSMTELRDLAITKAQELGISVKEAFQAIADGTIDTMKAATDAVADSAREVQDTVSDTASGIADRMADAAGTIRDTFSNLDVDIPVRFDVGGLSLGKQGPAGFGIPHLASGGVVTRPTLAVVGESGPEAIVPLSGGGGDLVITVPVQLDNVTFGEAVVRLSANELRRRGLG